MIVDILLVSVTGSALFIAGVKIAFLRHRAGNPPRRKIEPSRKVGRIGA